MSSLDLEKIEERWARRSGGTRLRTCQSELTLTRIEGARLIAEVRRLQGVVMKELLEKLNKSTPFRMFRPKKDQRCSRCREKIQANTSAWKPSKNIGSWKPNAVLCHDCVEPKK